MCCIIRYRLALWPGHCYSVELALIPLHGSSWLRLTYSLASSWFYLWSKHQIVALKGKRPPHFITDTQDGKCAVNVLKLKIYCLCEEMDVKNVSCNKTWSPWLFSSVGHYYDSPLTFLNHRQKKKHMIWNQSFSLPLLHLVSAMCVWTVTWESAWFTHGLFWK